MHGVRSALLNAEGAAAAAAAPAAAVGGASSLALAALGLGASAPAPSPPLRLPVDVLALVLSQLPLSDQCRASLVCVEWAAAVSRAADAQVAAASGARAPPALVRGARLRLLARLQRAHEPAQLAYLLAWAVQSRGEGG